MPAQPSESPTRTRTLVLGKKSSLGCLDNAKCPYCSWSFTSRVARTLSCGHSFYFCENCLPEKARIRCMNCKNITIVNKAVLSGKAGDGKSKAEFASDSTAFAIIKQSEKASARDKRCTASDTLFSIVSNTTELGVEKEKDTLQYGPPTKSEYYPEQANTQQHSHNDYKSSGAVKLEHLPSLNKSGLEEEYESKRAYVSRIRSLRKTLKTRTCEMKQKELKFISFSDQLIEEVEAGRHELISLKRENEDMTKQIKNVQLEKSIIEGELEKSLQRIKSLEQDSGDALKLKGKLEALKKQVAIYGSLKKQNLKLEDTVHRRNDKLQRLVGRLNEGIRGFKELVNGAKSEFVRSYVTFAECQNSAFGSLLSRVKLLEKTGKLVNRQYRNEQILRRHYFNEVQELKGNIRIFIRVRPTCNSDNRIYGNKVIVNCIPSTSQLTVNDPRTNRKRRFSFDKVFSWQASQKDVFHKGVKEFVTSAMDGYNVSILAYGQTGSGKTYTMTGKQGVGAEDSEAGIQYWALRELFRLMRERKNTTYELTLSVLEIYNDNIRDLLGPRIVLRREADVKLKNRPSYLKIRSTEEGQTYVEDLTEIRCDSLEDIVSLMKKGEANRSVGITNMNKYSSRSHSIVRIGITARNNADSTNTKSLLSFIDLAGSERSEKSGSIGEQAKEAVYINRSLSALGKVLEALRTKQVHIPYRDSKLTYLLQEFLNGKAKVSMFINLSPMSVSAEETMSSLNFGKRARATELGRARRSRSSNAGNVNI